MSTHSDDISDRDYKIQHQEQVKPTLFQRRRKLIIGGAVTLLCAVISTAIAVPLLLKESIQSNAIEDDQVLFSSSSTLSEDKEYAAALYTPDNQESLNPPEYAHAVSPYANLTRLKVYTPSPLSRIFVMGDVHGCLDEMNELLKLIEFRPMKDVLILTGDLVMRGQDSIGVVQRARELHALCVRGNHDDKVIRLRNYEQQHGAAAMKPKKKIMPEGGVGDPLKFGNKHIEIARMLNEKDYNYLVGCPLILDIPQLNARVVHGGIDPTIANILDNDPWSVMNMRDMDENKHPSKKKLSKNDANSERWTNVYAAAAGALYNNATIYYGHDASRGVEMGQKTIGVDSGCIYGRKLSAVEVRSRKLYQIDCSHLAAGDEEHDDD